MIGTKKPWTSTVTIPRSQYEALMAAAKMLLEIEEYETLHDACKVASAAIAALRAADIQIDGKHELSTQRPTSV